MEKNIIWEIADAIFLKEFLFCVDYFPLLSVDSLSWPGDLPLLYVGMHFFIFSPDDDSGER